GADLPGEAWSKGQPVWKPDVTADATFIRPAMMQLRGGLAYPIQVGGEVIGVLEFFSTQMRRPDSGLLDLMRALAAHIGQFMSRKYAEEALRAAEEKYRSIYEHAQEGIFQTTTEGRYLSANPALAGILGYSSPEELIASLT